MFGLLIIRANGQRRNPFRRRSVVVSVPDSTLTPGERRVFEEYEIVGAEPPAYEVDYLVPSIGRGGRHPQPLAALVLSHPMEGSGERCT
jgi:hypothetical protein